MSDPDSGPKAKVLECPSCGASITLRALGQSVMAVCPACHTQLDVSRPEIQIIRKYQDQMRRLRVALGTRGVLGGQKFEVIGAMQRSEDDYQWEEYLLFNPYLGFRWLIWDHGHWNLGVAVKDTSQIRAGTGVSYQAHDFRLFHHGNATVDWVVGEFYWRVKIGDRCSTLDYVAPPLMLSQEKDTSEINWTLSQYLQPADVSKAFGVSAGGSYGVAANEPNPGVLEWRIATRIALAAIALAFLIQIGTMIGARNSETLLGTYNFADRTSGEEQVFGPITLPARTSLNELVATAPLSDSWVELECSLVNTETGKSVDFTNAFEFYSGHDSDGYWSEGSQRGTSLLPTVPAGTYNLIVEGTGSNASGKPISSPVYLSFRHDVAPWRNFWLAVGVILLYPAFLLYRRLTFERRRWSQSEFGSSSKDD